MINRCCNPNNKRYYDYGGRGIKLCSEWRNKYKNFEKWALNNGYSDDLTIDRKDNNKGYYPKNCRWITRKENSRNMRNNRFITIDGCKKTLQEWSEIYSIRSCTVATRIRRGWNEIEAVTTPVKNKKGKVLNG
ncbi:hypothetical protein [Clostridium butyricum]|uniref:hypothetical protein n=1 Tax=Clostridium butyricum TaxID=1492 RepID=UPI00090B9A8C|nr:hypothetical protein [Clostridium butyricum]APF21215.1 hypothetical protein NPD4_3513 [Clostridium butyricum]